MMRIKANKERKARARNAPEFKKIRKVYLRRTMDAASSSTTTISLSNAELTNDPTSMILALPASTSQIPPCLPSSSEAIASHSVSPPIPMPSSISPTPSKPQPPIITKINVSKPSLKFVDTLHTSHSRVWSQFHLPVYHLPVRLRLLCQLKVWSRRLLELAVIPFLFPSR
jgi:hypothetical protein